MTEEEWLVCTDPGPMLRSLFVRAAHIARTNPAYPERFRRFAIACARRLSAVLNADELHALELLDRSCETRSYDDLKAARKACKDGFRAFKGTYPTAGKLSARLQYRTHELANRVVEECATGRPQRAAGSYGTSAYVLAKIWAVERGSLRTEKAWFALEADPEELVAQSHWLRDIFGNPFRPATFLPEWRTSTVLALAQQMYDSRDFSAMPILADALQDAGCDNAAILEHCRGPGPHVRGCWVVDSLLMQQ
jgi:hypothetical protein